MGFLNLFDKPAKLALLPRGSFTVDKEGRVLVSTLPQSFPVEIAEEIATTVLEAFHSAKTARITLNELIVRFANLKMTARELRGGAIIFLAPQTL
ncbi:MAG TPA: hypothetical protein VG754_14080 [Verrucomicrobiae bacterium]|jgi:hypothetical protein|nr:hypothetical protein [Verrucomicrobiae bacterium]